MKKNFNLCNHHVRLQPIHGFQKRKLFKTTSDRDIAYLHTVIRQVSGME